MGGLDEISFPAGLQWHSCAKILMSLGPPGNWIEPAMEAPGPTPVKSIHLFPAVSSANLLKVCHDASMAEKHWVRGLCSPYWL